MTYSFLFLLFTIAVGFRIAAAGEDPQELIEYGLDKLEDERDADSACDILLDTKGWVIYMNEYSNSIEYIIIANVVPVKSNCRRRLRESEIFYPSTCRIRVSTQKFDGEWFYGGHECKEGLSNIQSIAYPQPYYGRGYGGRYGGGFGGGSGPLPPFPGAPTLTGAAPTLSGATPFTGSVGPFAPSSPFSNPASALSAFDVGFFTPNNEILQRSLFSGQSSNSVRTSGNPNLFNLGTRQFSNLFGRSTLSSSSLIGLVNSLSKLAQPNTATDNQTPGSDTNQPNPGSPFVFSNRRTGPQPLQGLVLTGPSSSPLTNPLANVPLSGVSAAEASPNAPPPQIVNF